ncbi:MAG TPA: heparinase II/III-family protein [Chloroflexota bacterium]|nr:heparinase II/III-family protein [Chloroflexota bacterium]
MRTDWTHDALSVFFACHTPTSDSAHAHIDPMGFDFTALGRPLVVDPGRYCYRQDDDRRIFKTAAYHNSLMIDQTDPYPYLASGRSGRPKEGDIRWVQEGDGILAAEAEHRNYEPAIHRRVVAIVDGAFLLVLDHVREIGPERTVQVYYHLDAPDATWEADRRAAFSANAEVNVAIFASPNVRGTLLDGRVSDFLDVARPSRRLLLEDATPPAGTTRLYAAAIVAYRADTPTPSLTDLSIDLDDLGIRCDFTLNGQPYALTWSETGLTRR